MKFGGSKSNDFCTDGSTQGQNVIAVFENDQFVVPPGGKILTIYLLTKKQLYVALQVKCKIGEVLDYICRYLGLQQSKIFGLAIYSNSEYRFLDRNERVGDKSCVLRKSLSKSNGAICDPKNITSSVILYLRVHTYIDCIGYIKCPKSLHHYYLQLRENMKTQWDQYLIVEERCFEVASYALQADFGDFRPDLPSYFNPLDYFPNWVVEIRGKDFLVRHMPVMHSDLKGSTKEDCMIKFCREVSRPPWPINLNLYTLRKLKNDKCDNAYLGVTSKGLEFFEVNNDGQKYHIYTLIWSKIGKVAFDVRKFFVCGVDDKKLVFYTTSSEKSRYLLLLCRSIHQCLMNLHADLAEAEKAEIKESHQFRESYIYSDIRDFEWVQRCSDGNLDFQKDRAMLAGQRVSLVSGASSNTTSGIVSDRQQNHDSENDNEDEMDLELNDVGGHFCSSVVENAHTSATTNVYLDAPSKNNKKRSSTMIRVDDTDVGNETSANFIVVRTLAPIKDGTIVVDQTSDNELSFCIAGSATVNVGSVTASDRTLQAFSEDDHSVCTTCTIDKLNDSVDNDSSSYDVNSRKVSIAHSEPLKITSHENLGQSSATSNSIISIDNHSSSMAAIRYSANADNRVLPRSKFTVAELRQKTLDGFTGKFPPLVANSMVTSARTANGKPPMAVDNDRPCQKSSSMKTLSTTAQTQTSISYLSFYKSSGKVPIVLADSGSNSCYDIIESQTVFGNPMMQASQGQTDYAQLDSATYQLAENIPTIAMMQDFADANRSNNSKRWPTICGIDQKYLSHQDMQFFGLNNSMISQAKSEPRLTAWQLSVQDRECIPVCYCGPDSCCTIPNGIDGKSITDLPCSLNLLKRNVMQSQTHSDFPDSNCHCLSSIENQLANWSNIQQRAHSHNNNIKSCDLNYKYPSNSGAYLSGVFPSSSTSHYYHHENGCENSNDAVTDRNQYFTRQNEHSYSNGLYLKQRPTSSSSTSIYNLNVPVRNKNFCNLTDRSYGFRCSQAPVSRVQSMQIGRALNGSHLNSRLMAYRQKFLANGGQAGAAGFRHQRRTISSDAESAFIVNEPNCPQNAQNLCSSCRGEHHFSPDEIDLSELKSMISSRQDVDLPMIRALCDDTSLQDVRFRNGADKNNGRRTTETEARHPYGGGLLRPRSWHESAWLADNPVVNNDLQPQNESFFDPNMTNSIEIASSVVVHPPQPSSYETRFSSTPNLAASVASRYVGADAVLFLPPPPPYSTSNSALDADKPWSCNFYPSRQNGAFDGGKVRDDFYPRTNGTAAATGDFVYNVADREEYANFANGVGGVYAVNCNMLASEQAIR